MILVTPARYERVPPSGAQRLIEGLQKKFDVAEIVLQTGASFVSSLISGKLTECFASVLARRWIIKAYNLGIPGQYLTFKVSRKLSTGSSKTVLRCRSRPSRSRSS